MLEVREKWKIPAEMVSKSFGQRQCVVADSSLIRINSFGRDRHTDSRSGQILRMSEGISNDGSFSDGGPKTHS